MQARLKELNEHIVKTKDLIAQLKKSLAENKEHLKRLEGGAMESQYWIAQAEDKLEAIVVDEKAA